MPLPTSKIVYNGVQTPIECYGLWSAVDGTMTFELVGNYGGTIYATTVNYTLNTPWNFLDLIDTLGGPAPAATARTVAALVSFSTAVRMNAGYTPARNLVVQPSANALTVLFPGQVYAWGALNAV